MTEEQAIERAFRSQSYSATLVSLIDPMDPFSPISGGQVESIKVDRGGMPLKLTVKLCDRYIIDETDDGLREVPFVEVYQAHFVTKN